MKKQAFTLAEIMIVLTVIGIMTVIILPSARNLMPNQDLIKFKKAHNTLNMAIRELVNSDKYHLNGDLGVRADGELLDGDKDGEAAYFCNSLADVLNTKEVHCSDFKSNPKDAQDYGSLTDSHVFIDAYCRSRVTRKDGVRAEIVLPDGVEIYQAGPDVPFGVLQYTYRANTGDANKTTYRNNCKDSNSGEMITTGNCARRMMSAPDEPPLFYGTNGIDIIHKVICIDIDGILLGEDEENLAENYIYDAYTCEKTYLTGKYIQADAESIENAIRCHDNFENKCGNECPFGYAIRADGKIVPGIQALYWLEKIEKEGI